MTTQQKIDAICQDFLDRDQDNYVKIRRTGRLGWESMIPAGGNYSDVLRDCRSESDIVKEAYGMARDYIVAMDTPYRVTLRLSPEISCTDSRVVYLATRVFDDNVLSAGQKIDTFVGLAVHEGCHLKWTDFTQMGTTDNGIIRNLINILEDERIERLCGNEMPGYANFLKATKYYMFDFYLQKKAAAARGKALPAPVRLLNAILSIVRYPKALNKDDLAEFADELFEVRKVILEYPESPFSVTRAAKEIYEIIKHYFERKEAEKKAGSESDKEESGGESPKGGQQRSQAPAEGDDASVEQMGSAEEERSSQSVLDGLSEKLRLDVGEAVSEALSGLEQEMEDMSTITSNAGEQAPLDEDDMADCVRRDGGQLAGICENRVSIGETDNSVLYRAVEDKNSYDESFRRVRKYIPAIAKTLKGHCSEYAVTYRGMRRGFLDTGKIAEAYQGVQTVYVREGSVKSDRMAVCVLIDESGSMYGEKICAARDLAVLLNEAIGSISAIDLYIYGHTYADKCRDSYAEGRKVAELQVYREKGYAPRKGLGSVDARSGNLDSLSIREAAARMKKFSFCKKNLMFVITDGAPNERYEDLRETVKRLEKKGMDIVAVCIEPSYDPSLLYTHHVRFTDMSRLAIDLGKMIKKAILENSTKYVEL